jgi:hypothetical protein
VVVDAIDVVAGLVLLDAVATEPADTPLGSAVTAARAEGAGSGPEKPAMSAIMTAIAGRAIDGTPCRRDDRWGAAAATNKSCLLFRTRLDATASAGNPRLWERGA